MPYAWRRARIGCAEGQQERTQAWPLYPRSHRATEGVAPTDAPSRRPFRGNRLIQIETLGIVISGIRSISSLALSLPRTPVFRSGLDLSAPLLCWAAGRSRPISAPSLPPQLLGVDDRVNLTFLPPPLLVAYAVERPVVCGTERHGPFIAYLAAYGPGMGKAKMMCMARGAPAHQAGGGL